MIIVFQISYKQYKNVNPDIKKFYAGIYETNQ